MDDTNTKHFTQYNKLGTKKAFTLVELIIVITILAILATIAFISFNGYTKNARDGNRLSSLKNIETGLSVYNVQTGVYPEPEGNIFTGSVTTSEGDTILVKKGIIGENTTRVIKLSTLPKDPLGLTHYVYATTSDNREYQIGSVLENGFSSLLFIENTYADAGYQAKVLGNYKGYITFQSGGILYVANVPSLLWSGDIGVNLLQTQGQNTPKYIVNNGKNLPYHPNKGANISPEELGTQEPNEVIQEKTQEPNAKLISISKNELEQIVKELQKNENYELPQELKNSLGLESSQDVINSFGVQNPEDFDRVILGNKNTTSGKIIPKIAGVCGDASTSYAHNITAFTGGENKFCSTGILDGATPIFPSQGNSISWSCLSPDGGEDAQCSATRANPDEEVKACSGKPLNSKYFNGTDDYSVTVPFGTQAPVSLYGETPTENSCEYNCVTGYTNNAGRCNDLTPPAGGTFNINEGATNIDVTDVTLNITCAIDQVDGSDIQVAFGNTSDPTNWQNCSGMKSFVHTIPTGDGIKTVYVRFRDSARNISTAITQTITYQEPLYSFTTHTFTNCGMTGRTGPTLANCRAAYSTSWDENNNFFAQAHAQGIQLWTVPKTGTYRIVVKGAQGGGSNSFGGANSGGKGTIIQGDISLVKGEKIKILVGQQGYSGTHDGGGGGGTFVTKSDNSPLIVAGGGGGASYSSPYYGMDASISLNGTAGYSGGAGGTAGNGGTSSGYAAPGGGIVGNGGTSPSVSLAGGLSFINGGVGGAPGSSAFGGFGGGGGTHGGGRGGGGGGGYSGGGASSSYMYGGGGGASYLSGSNPSASVGNIGNGQVIITAL